MLVIVIIECVLDFKDHPHIRITSSLTSYPYVFIYSSINSSTDPSILLSYLFIHSLFLYLSFNSCIYSLFYLSFSSISSTCRWLSSCRSVRQSALQSIAHLHVLRYSSPLVCAMLVPQVMIVGMMMDDDSRDNDNV